MEDLNNKNLEEHQEIENNAEELIQPPVNKAAEAVEVEGVDNGNVDNPEGGEEENGLQGQKEKVQIEGNEQAQEEQQEEKENLEQDTQTPNDTPDEEASEPEEGEDAPADGEENNAEEQEEKPAEQDRVDEHEELEKVKQELAELKQKEEDKKELNECINATSKVENEFMAFVENIQSEVAKTFEKFNIDQNKTLEEIRKEDPAKAELAERTIKEAVELRQRLEAAAAEEIAKHQNTLILKRAARLMDKMEMTEDQLTEAAKTFVQIVKEVGVQDLEADLELKVQLAVGRAKMVAAAEEIVKAQQPKQVVEERNEEVIEEQQPEQQREEQQQQEEPPVEERKPQPEEQKPEAADYMDTGVDGGVATNPTGITVNNVLAKHAELPDSEKVAFYKEYQDLIRQAIVKQMREEKQD